MNGWDREGSVERVLGLECPETAFFLRVFDLPKGSYVMEVGCNDESSIATKILSEQGFNVIACDLRPPNIELPSVEYIQGDFCDLSLDVIHRLIGKLDCIFSISAIEHFGLCAYKELQIHPDYDVIAMWQARQLLKRGGVAFVSVPFAARFFVIPGAWRVYDLPTLYCRIGDGYKVEQVKFFFSGNGGVSNGGGQIKGVWKRKGDIISPEDAVTYSGHPPHLTAFMKLRKV